MSVVDMKEVIKELYPNSLKQLMEETKHKTEIEVIIKILKAKFGEVPGEVRNKLDTIISSETLDVLLKGAATLKTLSEFMVLL